MTSSTHLHINNRSISIVIPPLEITSRRYGWVSPETFNELACKKVKSNERKATMEWRKSRRTLCICYSSDDEKQKEARVFGAIGRHVPAAKRPMDSYYAAKTFFQGQNRNRKPQLSAIACQNFGQQSRRNPAFPPDKHCIHFNTPDLAVGARFGIGSTGGWR